MIRILRTTNKELAEVCLKEGYAPSPYDKESKFVPKDGGYTVYICRSDFKWYQIAARTVASLNLYSFRLTGEKLESLELYYFALAMFDNRHEIEIYVDDDSLNLSVIEDQVNTVCRFREIADSDHQLSSPVALVDNLFALVKEACDVNKGSVTLKKITRGDSEFEDCTGLKAVGEASDQDPCLGIIDYLPEGANADSDVDIALVGKGITFDTGGYSLKPDKYMETMRTDKTAAVYLAGALCLAVKLGLEKHVRVYLCCTENMVSGRGMLPGDILKYPNGKTVEINNTDGEGRLVLADGLLLASKDGAKEIIDMATLTGAAKIAVGRDMFSVIARDEPLYKSLESAFESCDEVFWRLPLNKFHRRFLSSRRADVTNCGHGEGAPGASVAASFLEMFVDEKTPWVHIDLSSAYLPDGSPFLAPGPTGSTILGLATYLSGKINL
ncbi:MAG: hypothetical protein ACI4NE_07750 [Succinivibrio sp.]